MIKIRARHLSLPEGVNFALGDSLCHCSQGIPELWDTWNKTFMTPCWVCCCHLGLEPKSGDRKVRTTRVWSYCWCWGMAVGRKRRDWSLNPAFFPLSQVAGLCGAMPGRKSRASVVCRNLIYGSLLFSYLAALSCARAFPMPSIANRG